MPRWLKHFIFLSLLIVFGGCAGSCSGCGGCGITPIPGGFPTDKRVENSTSVRLTESGLAFISQNLGPLAGTLLGGSGGTATNGVITFNVPPVHTSVNLLFTVNIDVCKNGPNPSASPKECIAEIGIGTSNLTITSGPPHEILVTGTLPVRVERLPIDTSIGSMCADLTANGGSFVDVPVNVDVSLETDTDPTHASRKGLTRVKINTLDIDSTTIQNNIHFGCGIIGSIVDALKGTIASQFIGPLTSTLKSQVDSQLCSKADPATGTVCPAGTYPDAGNTCRYCTPDANNQCPDTADCVGIALGTDGHMELGAALASLSPGTKGGLDFLGALGGEGQRDDGSGFLWGDLDPINNGATFGMQGGAEPSPTTTCVPLTAVDLPTGIPIPDEIRANTVPNWTGAGPDVGIAVSERYLNYVLAGAYNSGALCLGVGSDTLGSLLSSDTLGLLMPSLKDLGRQQKKAPLALVIRPQHAPSVVVGNGTDIATDPNLLVTLKQFDIDFYVFSSDRYIRAFSASFDLDVPVNLDVTDQGLAPVIDKVGVQNPSLFNDPLLREDEAKSATNLAKILSGVVGSALGGAIAPINLNSSLSSLGLTLNIPPSVQGQGSPGLRKLVKGTDNFLGIFASLGVAAPQPLWISQTGAEVSDKRVDPAGLVLPSITQDNVPTIEIRASSQLDTGARKIEYQYRLDGGFWHAWTTERYIKVSSPVLSLQAHHKVEVRSRVAGMPQTTDRTPAVVDVIIDKSVPELAVARIVQAGKVKVSAYDAVSPAHLTKVRWSLDGGAYGAWVPASSVSAVDVGEASEISVQAVDEEGNVATSQQALVRGRVDKSLAGSSGACGCSVPGRTSNDRGMLFGLPAILGLGLLSRLRRRGGRRDTPFRVTRARSVRTARIAGTLAIMAVASSWSGCSCGTDAQSANKSDGAAGAAQCPGLDTCQTIDPGLVGAYSSTAVASDGTIWVAGYDDIGFTQAQGEDPQPALFGDLVVGKWDGKRVAWEPVDGLPVVDPTLGPGETGGPADPTYYDVNGFRQGLTDPGDDVGLWTSIQLDASGNPMVAYYDATHRALKFASYDGTTWTTHVVEQKDKSDIGRYAKILMVAGKPVIAYLAIVPDGNGAARSGVRVATASKATPASGSDWTFDDATNQPGTPCRDYMCNTGQSCRVDTGQCEKPIAGCSPACASGKKCFDDGTGTPACLAVLAASTPEDYPNASGLYVALAPTSSGLGIVYYDRIHGNLMGVAESGGSWQPSVLLDGQGTDSAGKPVDTGDRGIGAGLFIDSSGDWHVTYVDGFSEALLYMKVTGGTTPTTPEVVDTGANDGGQAVVGDDSSISVTSSGEVHVSYQDATNGLLRYAVGVPNATGHDWTQKTLTVDGFAGAFSHIVDVGGATQVSTWWRKGKPKVSTGDVLLVKP